MAIFDTEESRQEELSRKERKEMKRQWKDKQTRRRQLLRLFKKIAVWTTVTATILFTSAGIFLSLRESGGERPADNNVPIEKGISYADQGRTHIASGESHPEYNSNPPTSGWHYAEAAKWGIYQNELPDEQLVHNLEHCGIWISYQPLIPPEAKTRLEAFAKGFATKVIVTPRAKNDAPVVLAAWGHLLKLASLDEVRMNAFILTHLNKTGPECFAP